MRARAASISLMKAWAACALRWAYHRSLSTTSASASGKSLTTRAGTLGFQDGLLDGAPRAALRLVLLEAVQPPIDLLRPRRLDVRFRVRVKAQDQPPGEIRPLLFRQLQRLAQKVSGTCRHRINGSTRG